MSFGDGTIKDMMMTSIAIKELDETFDEMLVEAATETGELHTLQALRAAIAEIEKEK
jgi:hypothetical protein